MYFCFLCEYYTTNAATSFGEFLDTHSSRIESLQRQHLLADRECIAQGFARLGAANRTEAVAIALRKHLLKA